ncbi:MAG: hypothetical protein E7317_08915 [Clostridiales bacterium]|nr:hypothetical protein [Clostridiales bacterium]
MTEREERIVERLLLAQCWVIDFLPFKVPADAGRRFFAVEKHCREPHRMRRFRQALADVMLKLGCYESFHMLSEGEAQALSDPPPEVLEDRIAASEDAVMLLIGESAPPDGVVSRQALFTYDPGDLYATVYGPSEALLALLKPLASSCGLFVRKGEDG